MKKYGIVLVGLALAIVALENLSCMNIPYYNQKSRNYETSEKPFLVTLTKEEKKYLTTIVTAKNSMLKNFEYAGRPLKFDDSIKKSEKDLFKFFSMQHGIRVDDTPESYNSGKEIYCLKRNDRSYETFLSKAIEDGDIKFLEYLLKPHLTKDKFDSDPVDLNTSLRKNDGVIDLKAILINCVHDEKFLETPLILALKAGIMKRSDEKGPIPFKGANDTWLEMMKLLVKNGAIVCEEFIKKQLGYRSVILPNEKKPEEINEVLFTACRMASCFVPRYYKRLARFMEWYNGSEFKKKNLKKVYEKNFTDIVIFLN
jgi:hypothetical protein